MKQGMIHELFNILITSIKKYSFDTLIKQKYTDLLFVINCKTLEQLILQGMNTDIEVYCFVNKVYILGRR